DVGALVLGLTSRSGGAAAAAVLKSGAPYDAAEAGRPGLWAFATSALPGGGRRTTARLLLADALPVSADLGPLLPLPAGMSVDPAARTVSVGQPAWDAVAAAGASLGRAVLRSAQGRHVVYFEVTSGQGRSGCRTRPPAWPATRRATRRWGWSCRRWSWRAA